MGTKLQMKKSYTESSRIEFRSILNIQTILSNNDNVDCSKIKCGDKESNIDGQIEFTDSNDFVREIFLVQVKHLTYPGTNGDVSYRIPQSIYGYADEHKGYVVIFIASDYANNKFYWRYIDSKAIKEFYDKSNPPPQSATYHFKENEICSEENLEQTIKQWKKIYKNKIKSVNDKGKLAKDFVSMQLSYFNNISSEISGVKNSHIQREQVEEIIKWIKDKKDEQLCMLIGNAGVGKSVILKDLISLCKDKDKDVEYVCIKADFLNQNVNTIKVDTIKSVLDYYTSKTNQVILVIDQIDALSQSFTNDRRNIQEIMSIISSLKDWKNIKAIVSCRKYDLEYDLILNQLKNNAKFVTVGDLTNKELEFVLNNLEQDLSKRLNKVTYSLLKNVQILNIFAFLYNKNKSKINFNNQIELYDHLWNNLNSEASLFEENESLIYKIVETIQKDETLMPRFKPISTKQKKAYDYLASQGIITIRENTVSFFHQSFYEYALAHKYLKENNLFAEEITKRFQGLELRSTIKAVLEFKKDSRASSFVNEVNYILQNPNIRSHIKLLALSILAFVEKPTLDEKKIFTNLTNEEYIAYFLKGVNSKNWFAVINNKLDKIIYKLKESDKYFSNIISFLSNYAFYYPEQVYRLIDNIQDNETKKATIFKILLAHNDYSKECVIDAFSKNETNNSYAIVESILDASKTNMSFALTATQNLVSSYYDSNYIDQNPLKILCSTLYKDEPLNILQILHNFICQTAQTGTLKGCKLLELYRACLSNYDCNDPEICSMVIDLLSLNNNITSTIAFDNIRLNPKEYYEQISSILADNKKIKEYLFKSKSTAYSFVNMIKSWFNTLDKQNQENYQRFLASYKGDFSLEYYKNKLVFPNKRYWITKWTLICNTLPLEIELLPELKKCYQELMRIYGRRKKIEEQIEDYKCNILYERELVSDEIYAQWTVKKWLQSLIKFNKDINLDNKFCTPIGHAEAFIRCISSNPHKFYNFVTEIHSKKAILPIYKLAGLKGLLKGGIDPCSLWEYTSQYMTKDFAKNNTDDFCEIAKYYIQDKNKYIDNVLQIINICQNVILDSFSEDKYNEFINLFKNNSSIINIPYPYSILELTSDICKIPYFKTKIYEFFINKSSILDKFIKILILANLPVNLFDKTSFLSLLKAFLPNIGIDTLYIPKIKNFFYENNIDLFGYYGDYINNIDDDSSSNELLALTYFHGANIHYVASQECRTRLEKLLNGNNENIIAKIVEASIKSYNNDNYQKLSIKYIEKFVKDNRQQVVKSYLINCQSLPIKAFSWFSSLIKNMEVKNSVNFYSLLDYIQKCHSTYPDLCYKLIASLKFCLPINEKQIINNEILQFLLENYRQLKQWENIDLLNDELDLLEQYLVFSSDITKDINSVLE